MAVSANLSAGTLSLLGDTLDNTIGASRDAAGNILINGGTVAIAGGPAPVVNTSLIEASGQNGNDTISLDESNGALPAAHLFGNDGNDTLTGGSGADQLFGGAGDDTLVGGAGDDQLFGEAGNDRTIWNPGDGTDLFEGGDDVDTAEVNGGNGAEIFTIVANGARVRFDRVSPAPFSLDIGTTENLVVHANGGDDTITASNGLAALISLTLDGGDGNDTITGGDGADLIIGGRGNDIVKGGRGNDTAFLGNDDDTFIWGPGDGNDTVEGEAGFDTLLFDGSNAAEDIDISANGSRAQLLRNVGGVTMDLNGVEKIAIKALGGVDNLIVSDFSGTDVKQVAIDLQANGGGGDGAADTVFVSGTSGANQITVGLDGSTITVNGLAAQVLITGHEAANDKLNISGLDGDDVIDASALPAGQISLSIDGGAGNDVITGSAGDDFIDANQGNDTVTGGRGNDTVQLGNDDDTFIWNPGDGSDIVEGEAGFDTLIFNGANIDETVDISANGTRVSFGRDVGSVVMDLNSVEKIVFHALAGADMVTVNDLTATGVRQVAVDLQATGGGGDGQADTVIVNGTGNADHVSIGQSGQNILIDGLAAQVVISGQEVADKLVINGLAGADVIDASGLAAGQISLTINGGDGADVILGSAGNDTVNGGRDNDVAFLGGGDDTFIWNPGDGSDIVEGQDGFDTLIFNGANIAEQIDISANGSHARFTRDVASITMDLGGIEKIAFHALGGADTITVGDLSGTGVQQVAIDLTATGGVGDGSADTVMVNAAGGADQITVTQSGSDILVNGLAAQVSINGQEAVNDTLQIRGLGGADIIDASSLAAGQIKLAIDGGAADDVITGSRGNDLLTGGIGNDLFVARTGGAADDITDFIAGAGTPDRIDVRAFAGAGIHGIGDVLAHATQTGADTVIDFGGGDTLTLRNVTRTDLSADDFVFALPAVVSVTTAGGGITAGSGDLNAGHVVTFTLTFDEAINVTGGAPTLLLNDGGVATLTGGSGSSALTFQYIVANGENTPDLTIAGVNLHGATLRDASGNNADLSGAIVNPAGTLQIDTIAPHLDDITATGIDSVRVPGGGVAGLPGSVVHFTLDFDEAVNVTGGTPTLTLNGGRSAVYNAAATALLGDPSKLVFDYVVAAGDPPTGALTVTRFNANGATVDDLAHNHADLSHIVGTFNESPINQPAAPPVLPGPAEREIHLDLPPTFPGASPGFLAGIQETLTHFPIAELHTISDFHLV